MSEQTPYASETGTADPTTAEAPPTPAQRAWLRRGLAEPGGKLPLFDRDGQRVSIRTVRSCLDRGWAEPWFANPLKPDWLVCKLTVAGRRVAAPAQHVGRAAGEVIPIASVPAGGRHHR